MANINGIPVENIVNINSIDATSIQSISGIPTANISGWPGAGPSCESRSFRFGPSPGAACAGDSAFYDFDATNNILYVGGECGTGYATPGFYVDDNTNDRYWWHVVGKTWVWESAGACI